jgi:glycosyltransferase involved in cell wall biosynthesis
VIVDTGKEWGGGTNSLLELLSRIDRTKYRFTCVFYDDYRQGREGPRISEVLARLGVSFVRLPRRPPSLPGRLLKEFLRGILFFNPRLKRLAVFLVDYWLRIRPDARRLEETLRGQAPQLVYLNNQPSSNLEGILAARAVGIPALQHARIEAALNPFEVRVANTGLRGIIAVSEGVRRGLVGQGIDPSRCVIVHNGIATDTAPHLPPAAVRARWGIGEGEVVLGTAGSLVRRKRVGDLIGAVAALVAGGGSSLRCMIVGEGPERERLQAEAERYGVAGRVVFAGFQAEAVSYINTFDVFALPSEREGLPRVILEAMLMGKPVVASAVSGPSELVVDGVTGFLCPPGDAGAWHEALRRLVMDEDLRKRMGEAGRQRVVEHFSIERYVAGVEAVLARVLVSSTGQQPEVSACSTSC